VFIESILDIFNDGAATTASGRLSHRFVIRLQKEYFL